MHLEQKKKKRSLVLSFLLSLLMVVCLAFASVSCNQNPAGSANGSLDGQGNIHISDSVIIDTTNT